MPGEGFVFDMIANLKRNNSYLGRKSYFETKIDYKKAAVKQHIDDPKKATPQQLRAIRENVVKNRKKDTIKRISIFVVSLIITVLVLVFAAYRIKIGLK